ncbi:MAG: tetratricopeptide repeat protein [Planctomycetota bacterium]|jgi:tetratricopeptide (TPR) repeat protein
MVFTAMIVVLVFGSIHAQAAVKKDVSSKTLRSMARTYLAFGDYEKAHTFAAKALNKANTSRADVGEKAICMIDLATVYSYQGNLEKSETLFTQGVHLQKQALFANHPYVAQTLRMLSEVHRRQGDYDHAEQTLSQATEIMQAHTSTDSKEMAPFILESAKLLADTGNFEQSESQYQKALTLFKESYGTNHLMTANVYESMSALYLDAGELDQADQYISQALKTKTKIFGRYHSVLIDSMLTKARICRLKGRVEKSEYYLSKVKGAVENSKNVITTARVYQQVNQIRNEGLVAAAVTTN